MNKFHSLRRNFQIARLTPADVKHKTDNWKSFENLILSNEEMYPEIENWLNKRVIPELSTNERIALIGYDGDVPIVSAVLKCREKAKFCHLRIYEEYQDMLLGDLFFTLMTLEVRNYAKEIHFTLPETLWERKKNFFKAFGFDTAIESLSQYRHSERELKCSAPFYKVWGTAIDKIPRLSACFALEDYAIDNNTLLMSIKPSYVDRILSGKKDIEIRKKFSHRWIGHKVSIYASKPIQAIVGKVQIQNVIVGEPMYIWEKFRERIGCTKQEFYYYAGSSKKITAIFLKNPQPFTHRIPLQFINELGNKKLIPPQSYAILEKGKSWSAAVSIATFLKNIVRL